MILVIAHIETVPQSTRLIVMLNVNFQTNRKPRNVLNVDIQ